MATVAFVNAVDRIRSSRGQSAQNHEQRARIGRALDSSQTLERTLHLFLTSTRAHSLTLAQRAAVHLGEHYRKPLNVGRLARLLACNQTRLRDEFRGEYGTTPRDYHVRLRVAAALHHMASEHSKTSVIARAVGYRDDRNFYRVVRQVTGRTPGALAHMKAGELRALATQLAPRHSPSDQM